jgi:hypothetical protein
MGISATRFGLSVLLLLIGLNCVSRADEGLARITQLGDRDLVAQANKGKLLKAKSAPYKSVEDEAVSDESTEAWKGKPFPQTNNFFFGAGLNYFDNLGFQGRYAVRLMPQGPIPDMTNSIWFEGGLGLTFYGTKRAQTGVTGIDAVVTGRWDFQLDPNWTFFGDLGVGYNAVSNDRQDDVKGGGFFPAVGVGVIASITVDWAIRADLSYQFLGLGLSHRF